MRKLLFAIILCAGFAASAFSQSAPPWTIQEIDGSPRVNSPTLIKITNGALSCSGKTCTITVTGGSGSPGGASGTVQWNDSGAFNGTSGLTATATTITIVNGVTATFSRAGVLYTGTVTTDNSSVQTMLLQGDRATVASNDEAYVTYRLSNAAGTQTEVARMTWAIPDPTAGAEYGRLDFSVMGNSSLAKELQLSSDDLSPAASSGLSLGTSSLPFLNLSLSSFADLGEIAAPANPGANTIRLFADSGTGKLTCLDDVGGSCMPAGVSGANPTASVGLSAVNGVATTYLRSDGAPALDQGITPTWTGAHAFSNTITQTSNSATAFQSGPNGGTNPVFLLVNNVASAATGISITGRAAAAGATIGVISSGTNENLLLVPKGTGQVHLGDASTATSILRLNSSGSNPPVLSGSNLKLNLAFSGNNHVWEFVGGTAQYTIGSTILRGGTANLAFGAADAASPVAQTLSVQNVVAGTSDTAGANWTFSGSRGTGTGAGGSLIFQVAPPSATGTTQNTLAAAFTLASTSTTLTVPTPVQLTTGAVAGYPVAITASAATASSSTVGAAAGGTITYTSGAAARLTSGNAAGGDHLFILGAGIGTGRAGMLLLGGTTSSFPAISKRSGAAQTEFLLADNSARSLIWSAGMVVSSATVGTYTGAVYIDPNIGVRLGSTSKVAFHSTFDAASGTDDLAFRRLAAASLVQGLANNATPVANLFTIGESSRGGTDSNVAGANGTIQAGLGTGTGGGGSLIFRTGTPGSTGTTANSYATALTINAAGHLIVTGTAPTIASGFGTSPSIAGADHAGRVTVGTGGVATTGAITFGQAFATAPACTVNNETTILLAQATATTTTLTITSATPFTASDTLTYVCLGY
jgi:hypothetical protein